MTFTLQWRDGEAKSPVSSVAELDALLDQAEADAAASDPLLAVLTRDDGRSLSIGLGRPVTNLSSTGEDGMPPYHTSDSGGTDNTPVVFYYLGHWSEFPTWSCVGTREGREAMRYFLLTGELLPDIRWREA